MGRIERIRNILTAIVMLGIAALMLWYPEDSYVTVCAILSVMLLLAGIRNLVYYASMARFMVGGHRILYMGILLLDMGIFAGGLTTIPRIYVMLYLLCGYAFTGLVNILRAREAKGLDNSAWKHKLGHGIIDLVIAMLCLVFLRSARTAVLFYCIGLVHAACVRIENAFRRTAIVYIQ